MPIRFSCPTCHASYTIRDEQGGKKLRCRNCQAVIVAPTASQDDDEANDSESRGRTRGMASSPQRPMRRAPEEDTLARQRPITSGQRGGKYSEDADADEDDRPRSRRPRTPAAGNRTPWIIGGAIGGGGLFLGLIICLVVLFRSGKPATPPPAPVAAVSNQRIEPPPEPAPSPTAPIPAKTPATPTKVPPVVNKPTPAVDLATAANTNNGQLTPETMRKVKRATVYLLVRMADGSMASGSGFLALQPGLILTNAHVLGMLEPESSPPQAVEATLNSGERDEKQFGVQIVGVDKDSDLAVLRAGTAGMPEPLDVKSASSLIELQKVYVFGFPFGSRLGREITIRESSVASLRRKNGILERVQVNGGMDPGNSGGPVVDTHGAVVGVAVAGIPGTSINFAVPGERVHIIMNGRLVRLGLHQPYQQGEKTMLPVVAEMIDPFKRIRDVAVEIWTGDKGKPRPPSDQQPKPLAGDSDHQRHTLAYNQGQGEARGDIALPPLPPGKVYWFQPSWVNGAGQTQWATATVHAMSQPVERKPVRLQMRHQVSTRLIDINSIQIFKIHSEAGGDGQTLTITIKTQMQENIYGISAQGAMIRLYYTPKFKLGVDVKGGFIFGEEDADREIEIQKLTKAINRLSFNLCVDSRGKLTSNNLDVRKVPDDIRDRVKRTHEQIQHSFEALAVPLPNRQVQVNDTWTDICPLPIDAVGKYESGSMQMVYTYLGRRRNAKGQQEAVIKLSGKLRGLPGHEQTIGGNTDGQAVVDVATGQVREANVKVSVDMRVGSALHLTGTLRVDLKRPL